MTKAQAHRFVERWNRIIRPRVIRTPEETIRVALFRLQIVVPIISLFTIGLLCYMAVSHKIFPVFNVAILDYSVSIFGIWNIIRLRQARRVLESPIANRQS